MASMVSITIAIRDVITSAYKGWEEKDSFTVEIQHLIGYPLGKRIQRTSADTYDRHFKLHKTRIIPGISPKHFAPPPLRQTAEEHAASMEASQKVKARYTTIELHGFIKRTVQNNVWRGACAVSAKPPYLQKAAIEAPPNEATVNRI